MIDALPFQSSVVHPVSCIREAWFRIREDYWLFFAITLVGILIGSAVPFGILMGPMMCGMAKCYLDKGRGLPIRFDMLFKGFDHFKEALIATLILLGISLVIILPFMFLVLFAGVFTAIGAANSDSSSLGLLGIAIMGCGGFLALLLLSILVGSILAFTFPLISDRKLSGTEAIRLGAKAALANWQGMIGLGLLVSLVSLAGLCCCYLGVFFVAPITLGAHMIAYEKVFGRSEDAAIPLEG